MLQTFTAGRVCRAVAPRRIQTRGRLACLAGSFVIAAAMFLVLPGAAHADWAVYQYSFSAPGAPITMMVHSNGELWVGTWTALRRYTKTGTLLGTIGPFAAAGLAEASNGDVFVGDYYGLRILRYTSGGTLVRQWATGGTRTSRLAVDASDNVYAALYTNAGLSVGKIVLYAGDTGAILHSCSGIPVVNGIAYKDGTVYTVPRNGGVVKTYTSDLQPLGSFPTGGTYHEQLVIDSYANLWLADYGTRCVLAFTSAGTRLGAIGPAVSGYGTILPEAVAVDPSGPIFVGDNTQQRVVVFGSPATAITPAAWSAVKQLFR